MKSDEDLIEIARCFNEGSDARLAGRRPEDCPYENGSERSHWILGWKDVHLFWGSHVHSRWRYRPLVPFLS
jgi:ribosome modulation factor